MNDAQAEHRAFLNRYYGLSRAFYDLTRRYYLFGRDRALRELAGDPGWRRLAELGPGTGRNLAWLHRARPDAVLGGIDASDAMLEHARARCPWAMLEHGFAETAPIAELLGAPPDRVLLSYCLSMVEERALALSRARSALARGGEVVVVDFADLGGLPRPAARAFRAYLGAFRVVPLDDAVLEGASSVRFGPARYYVIARYGPTKSTADTTMIPLRGAPPRDAPQRE